MFVVKCPRELTAFVEEYLKGIGKIIKKSEGAFLFEGKRPERPEITRVFDVICVCESKIEEIKKVCSKIFLKNCSFAVRTEKRGKILDLSSLDVNRIIGELILKNGENVKVNLENPDIVIAIEVFDEKTAVCIVRGKDYEFKKYLGKKLVLDLMKKIKIAQMVYWGEGAYKMGERIGRAAQSFEIKELIIFFHKKINLEEFYNFLRGVLLGINSRYEIQKKIYSRDVEKIKVTVYDLYHLVLEERAKKSFIIVTDPRGESLEKAKEKIKDALKSGKEILIINGSREGVPVGIFRYSDIVIDLAPGITFATEHAIPTILTYLIEVYLE